MSADRLHREARLQERRVVLGSRSPRCIVPDCSETDPRALTGSAPDILCTEHRALAAGRSPHEGHHVAGRQNDVTTVELLANWHAALTHEQQTAWPRELLRNPDADPLVAAEARIRGSRETIAVILERPLAEAEAELGRLRRFLERSDPSWADDYRAWLGDDVVR